jgi:uncharacterized protein YbjT (DUF2867 family)
LLPLVSRFIFDIIAMTGKTAILLGASGSVGQALLAELVHCGQFNRVVAIVRRSLGGNLAAIVEERMVPTMDPSSLAQVLVDALREDSNEVVGFSVLGVGAETAKLSIEQHRAVDVELNAAFAKALNASGKVRHLAFMSAVGADIQAKTTGSGAAGMARYARVKGEAEAAVREGGPAVVSIFRPSLIEGSQHTPRLLSVVFTFLSPLIPRNYRPIRTSEIAKAMVAAALQRPATSAVHHYPEMKQLIAGACK